jgi:hypothetical protein
LGHPGRVGRGRDAGYTGHAGYEAR